MNVFNNVILHVIKNDNIYEIYINNDKIDYFKNNQQDWIDEVTRLTLNSLLRLSLNKNELQNYLIKNYLEKDVEDMTNQEFADYLLQEINSDAIQPLRIDCPWITYGGVILYKWDSDEINFQQWHYGLLRDKFDFCKFNGSHQVCSKGNRKRFAHIVKQTIDYLESFKITDYKGD